MAYTGWKYPGTTADGVVEKDFFNTDNVKVDDGVYADSDYVFSFSEFDASVWIVKNVTELTQKSLGTLTTSDQTFTTGSSSDLWSQTWNVTEINASTFGFHLKIYGNEGTGINVTNFGFNVPTGSTIDGIEFRLECKRSAKESGNAIMYVDFIQARVYYTTSTTSPFPSFRRQ